MSATMGTDDVVIYLEGGIVQDVKVGRPTRVTRIDFDLAGYLPDEDEGYCRSCELAKDPHYHDVSMESPQ